MIVNEDCVKVMAGMPAGSVDAIVTDPPYGLEFMGKEWDRLGAVALQDPAEVGGFQDGNGGNAYSRSRIRFGQDARSMQAWHEAWAREALRVLKPGGHLLAFGGTRTYHRLACAIEDAGFEIRDCLAWMYGSGFPKSLNLDGDWEGWGTALKPAHEPIVLARKPLTGTVAGNVQAHGTGALNIDGCRIEGEGAEDGRTRHGGGVPGNGTSYELPDSNGAMPAGRWPANVVVDEVVAGMLPPWFYVPKSSSAERNAGLNGFDERETGAMQGNLVNGQRLGGDGTPIATPVRANVHPTVKPINLMRWLTRLVTPPGGTVLDPFTGSGTTGIAATLEGFQFTGIERDPEYARIAEARIAWWAAHPDGMELVRRLEHEAAQKTARDAGQLDLFGA